MIVAAGALASMLETCAAAVEPSTMHAIITVESGITASATDAIEVHPWAIGDNTTRRSYAPATYSQAVALANGLLARGDNIDVGLAQVNSANFAGYRVSAATMLVPCQNLMVASRILANAYVASSAVFAEPRVALWHALSAYNTGSLYAGARYVVKVVAGASRRPVVPSINLLTVASAMQPTKGTQQRVMSRPPVVVRTIRKSHRPRATYAVVVADSRTLAITLAPNDRGATMETTVK